VGSTRGVSGASSHLTSGAAAVLECQGIALCYAGRLSFFHDSRRVWSTCSHSLALIQISGRDAIS
jgi:hypothetical protein